MVSKEYVTIVIFSKALLDKGRISRKNKKIRLLKISFGR